MLIHCFFLNISKLSDFDVIFLQCFMKPHVAVVTVYAGLLPAYCVSGQHLSDDSPTPLLIHLSTHSKGKGKCGFV